ncbi:DUF262 domain-containing protein [Curtobacterium flaccumfaciens]|uniref:DUF262 domain-containing protein n=1 Tax=Curtobacterium flaccumfaciens TaxID=2035 RepID=UPI00220C01B9|nr:DUF262 domain-containing protein [Curtobacterium flaccumfaciens]UWD81960.1 DUF262 domain-containing protein [Curtobacterium flaccumfaciens]
MKLEPWEPDLSSLYLRYKQGTLDLQPAFQRGQVWPGEKRARLVDTVLRGWRIPPVHLVLESDESLSVLDGQQRLQALFDFLGDKFAVAPFAPLDEGIEALSGLKFSGLPEVTRRRINSTRISAYRLYEFQPDEPYELFFRLNLPTALTQAEKRNALAGKTRRQVRQIVDKAVQYGWNKDLLGFSDGRLAYDDVVARACAYVERGAINLPLGTKEMEKLYRDKAGLDDRTVEVVTRSVEFFTSETRVIDGPLRFNKATLLTWLLVAARAYLDGKSASLRLSETIRRLEGGRALVGRRELESVISRFDDPLRTGPLVSLYVDRSSLRVADVLSVQARDAVAWLALSDVNNSNALPDIANELKVRVGRLPFKGAEAFENGVIDLISGWGEWGQLR